MASVLKGEIRWAEPDPTRGNEPQGTRPVLVISRDVFNERSGAVVAVAITSQPQRAVSPLTLPLGRLRKLGRVTPVQLAKAIDGLNEIVGD